MKIQPVNINNNYSFQAKRKEVRNADDIVRNVNNNFPIYCPSYVKRFWKTINVEQPRWPMNTLRKMRISRPTILEKCQTDKYVIEVFEQLKDKKIANCEELSWITLGALAANGYDVAERTSVALKWNVIDKKNNETVLKGIEDLDHSLVLTTMTDKQTHKPQNAIILDAWLHKAMNYSEAQREYFSLVTPKHLAEIKLKFIEHCKKENPNIEIQDIDFANYEVNLKIDFKKRNFNYDIDEREDIKEFGKIVAERYPELIINNIYIKKEDNN